MGDYYCPNCGADLEDQSGFDPYGGYWTCTECGQFLTDPDDSDDSSQFDGVGWFCDGCGAYLNKQSGFSDWCSTWTCTECGHTNSISEDEIYDSEADYQRQNNEDDYGGGILGALAKGFVEGMQEAVSNYNSSCNEDDEDDEEDDDEYDDDDNYDDDNSSDYYNDLTEDYSEPIYDEEQILKQQEYERQCREEQLRHQEIAQAKKDKRKAVFKRVWSAIAHKKMIDINVSSADLIGINYLKAIAQLERSGFTTIRTNIVEDLEYYEIERENVVSAVSLDGSEYFEFNNQAKYDSDIVITIHKLKRVVFPVSYKDAKKQKGQDIEIIFKNAGFVNINCKVIKDLKLGWLKKDGKIDSIVVADEKKYMTDKKYRIDTPIEITYHTFKNK